MFSSHACICIYNTTRNGSGSVSKSEMRNIFQTLHFKVKEKSIDDLMSQLDAKNEGAIKFKEFQKTIDQRFSLPLASDKIKEVFVYFDSENSGFITTDKIVAVFKLVGKKFRPDELKRIMKKMDPDGTAQVTLDEFTIFLK
jgi:Ca2+-binding EF-hand superfamily protein